MVCLGALYRPDRSIDRSIDADGTSTSPLA
jgi:hypothetical protein